MLINWFTVAAQIVNFLILVALLKRFLYGPIVRAMAAREERIAAEMAEAPQKRQEAEQEEACPTPEDAGNRGAAPGDAGPGRAPRRRPIRQKLFDQARQEVAQIRQKWAESLKREKDTFLQNLKQRLAPRGFRHLPPGLPGNGRTRIWNSACLGLCWTACSNWPRKSGSSSRTPSRAGGANCWSPPLLNCPRRPGKNRRPNQEQFGQDLTLRFATSGELLAGIEMLTSSRKIAWSLGASWTPWRRISPRPLKNWRRVRRA